LPKETPVFFVEPTDRAYIYLRRYSHGPETVCSVGNYHNKSVFVEERPAKLSPSEDFPGRAFCVSPELEEFAFSSLWPTNCDCGYKFGLDDEFQVNAERIYESKQRPGEKFTLRDDTPGMMWDAWWYSDHYKGRDGMSLVAVCPDGKSWMIDSRCSNCTMPDDDTHDCWCRHGEPPLITVDKNPEPGETTCQAGAGSIQTYKYIDGKQLPSWHGFLRNGIFVE
jgi:hypothetical protein